MVARLTALVQIAIVAFSAQTCAAHGKYVDRFGVGFGRAANNETRAGSAAAVAQTRSRNMLASIDAAGYTSMLTGEARPHDISPDRTRFAHALSWALPIMR